MAKVTDPSGVQWSVHRRWMCPYLDVTGGSGQWGPGVGVLVLWAIILLQIIVIWPCWFIAHWLGVPWIIVIERNGTQVFEARGHGWGESRRRIQEIAESAAAGSLKR
ncbi:MAG TPA: hypothetical protein VH185_01680 [Mycobacterium sp.]|nr:hypothetical protein [Mycobacterium sp.]